MPQLRFLLAIDYKLSFLGGAQTAFEQQALALRAAGHAVTVLAPDAGGSARLREAGVRLVEARSRGTVPGMDLPVVPHTKRLRASLRREMTTHRPSGVVVHSEFGLATAVLAVARELGIPSAHTVHTFFWRGPAAAGIAAPLVRGFHRALTGLPAPGVRLAPRALDSALREMTLACARTADTVLSPSAHQAEALRAAGLPRVEVLSNTSALATEFAEPVAPRPLRLVWAGRFAPEKRIEVALDAIRLAEAELGPDAVVLEVAGGEPPRSLRDAAPASVRFLGRLTPAQLSERFAAAHAALITSHGFDNQPMVAIEAFRLGRPVVVSDPVLATEFGAAAIGAVTPEAAGLAETLMALSREPGRLDAAAAGARAFSEAASGDAHAATLVELLVPRR
ncbi:glycosyltransferase [Leucobacter sp. M11]|uniref:glycosyltransferase n=1 Tax=Leucobacter sp. M11 TaxID=2993565 RepID=UPI002D80F159|nr:glycosyltransferase [Leucobacter sp. M11]MEB4614822.1 glycosyltransferase [Leucobacter sp. M11]